MEHRILSTQPLTPQAYRKLKIFDRFPCRLGIIFVPLEHGYQELHQTLENDPTIPVIVAVPFELLTEDILHYGKKFSWPDLPYKILKSISYQLPDLKEDWEDWSKKVDYLPHVGGLLPSGISPKHVSQGDAYRGKIYDQLAYWVQYFYTEQDPDDGRESHLTVKFRKYFLETYANAYRPKKRRLKGPVFRAANVFLDDEPRRPSLPEDYLLLEEELVFESIITKRLFEPPFTGRQFDIFFRYPDTLRSPSSDDIPF